MTPSRILYCDRTYTLDSPIKAFLHDCNETRRSVTLPAGPHRAVQEITYENHECVLMLDSGQPVIVMTGFGYDNRRGCLRWLGLTPAGAAFRSAPTTSAQPDEETPFDPAVPLRPGRSRPLHHFTSPECICAGHPAGPEY